MEPATIVIDNGTGYTKMGYSGNFEPSYMIPSLIANKITPRGEAPKMNNPAHRNPELDFLIGEEALTTST
jgi:actin-related protein 3